MDVPIEQVVEMRRQARRRCSRVGEDGESVLGDFIEDSDAVVPIEAAAFIMLQDQLEQILDTLSPGSRRSSSSGSD